MRMVKILRGLPGSGKSYWVGVKIATMPSGFVSVASADYAMMEGDKYIFKPEKLKEAHDGTLLLYARLLQQGRPYVVVDNTNLSTWEIAPYYRLAEAYGYEVSIVEFRTPVEVCFARQVHGVPALKLGEMKGRFDAERLPPWWRIEVVHYEAPPNPTEIARMA